MDPQDTQPQELSERTAKNGHGQPQPASKLANGLLCFSCRAYYKCTRAPTAICMGAGDPPDIRAAGYTRRGGRRRGYARLSGLSRPARASVAVQSEICYNQQNSVYHRLLTR